MILFADESVAAGLTWGFVLPILIPALTTVFSTIVVAVFLTRRNERYRNELTQETEKFKNDLSKETEKFKNDLAKENHRFQSLHPKRLQLMVEIMKDISRIVGDLELALKICEHDWFYVTGEHQASELSPIAQRVSKSVRELESRLAGEKFLFDDKLTKLLDEVVLLTSKSSSTFIPFVNEETEETHVPALTDGGVDNSKRLIKTELSAVRTKLEQATRQLLFAE
ncbi:MAG: hypothetical protein AB7V18_04800 [Pyrinomonadaceae bacterium]|jgi:hypothetical protein